MEDLYLTLAFLEYLTLSSPGSLIAEFETADGCVFTGCKLHASERKHYNHVTHANPTPHGITHMH